MTEPRHPVPDEPDNLDGEDYRAGSVEGGSSSGEGDDIPESAMLDEGAPSPRGPVGADNASQDAVVNTGDPDAAKAPAAGRSDVEKEGGDDVDAASG
jgi:hypothetical protein